MSPVGHSADSLATLMEKIGATSVDDLLRFLGGKETQAKS